MLHEFNKNSGFYQTLAYLEQKDVINLTDCKIPCHYREMVVVGTPTTTKVGKEDLGIFRFSLSLVSTDIRVEEQALLYNFITLVSNFGGSLGLFLGFSFFMVWDWIVFLFQKCKGI